MQILTRLCSSALFGSSFGTVLSSNTTRSKSTKYYMKLLFLLPLKMLKDTPKTFDNFKKKQKSVGSKSKYILKFYSIYYTLRIKTSVKKISFGQNKLYKQMYSFFFPVLELIIVLFLICNCYMNWSTRFVSLKVCEGISIFDSVSFLLKFTFSFNKKHGLLSFKKS